MKEETSQFLDNELRKLEVFENEAWNYDVFFLCDIKNHLNVQLQGKNYLILKFVATEKVLKMKLKLFKSQLAKRKCVTFLPMCSFFYQKQTC